MSTVAAASSRVGTTTSHVPPTISVSSDNTTTLVSMDKTEQPTPANGDAQWGANFWVTLIDPMTQAQFYACPATGQCSWDPPVGNFVLPPSPDGEWWELSDESRGGLSYYYHTVSGETVWERPEGFVIPLGIIQTTSIGRRLSLNATSFGKRRSAVGSNAAAESELTNRNSVASARSIPTGSSKGPTPRTASGSRGYQRTLDDIPGSSASSPPSPDRPTTERDARMRAPTQKTSSPSLNTNVYAHPNSSRTRSSSSFSPTSNQQRQQTLGISGNSQSLQAVASEVMSGSTGARSFDVPRTLRPASSASHHEQHSPTTPTRGSRLRLVTDPAVTPASPRRPIPGLPSPGKSPARLPIPGRRSKSNSPESDREGRTPRHIGRPVLDPEATRLMNPAKTRTNGPIFITPEMQIKRFSTGDHRTLPRELAQDIQKFVVSDFAKRYFSTHRTGLIFRRKVPVELMMTWQKQPLSSPLLVLNRSLHRDAVKIFKVIQRIMGDRDRDRPVGVRMAREPIPTTGGGSSTSLIVGRDGENIRSGGSTDHSSRTQGQGVLEEERWLLAEGVSHGEMRDEIYCQLVKQLSGNPNPESIFRGWQLLCVLLVTFPPSKNFEAYLRGFMTERLHETQSRIDVMAKYCLSKLPVIAKKGPRGKAPTVTEIENASDAAFNPSTFGESLDSIFRLQERTYAELQVPIILPFLADGILALGGTKSEGIFRVPGEGDNVSELRTRIDKGYYNLEGIEDPHVPASLLKLWLRELQDPLVPQELYNDCIGCAEEPDKVVAMVGRLPTINRRVILFVISFLQLFLEEKVLSVTKMTSANLALVMAPNLLRCNSDSMAVVFNNARFEQIFVYNLLLHLKCNKVDPEYIPVHGLGAGGLTGSPTMPRISKSRSRRPHG